MGDADAHDAILWRQAQRLDAAPGKEVAIADADRLLVQRFGDILRAAPGGSKRYRRRSSGRPDRHAVLADDPNARLGSYRGFT
jgi:hypothetical protein